MDEIIEQAVGFFTEHWWAVGLAVAVLILVTEINIMYVFGIFKSKNLLKESIEAFKSFLQ